MPLGCADKASCWGPGLAIYLAKLCKKELRDEDREISSKFSPYREFAGVERLK